MVVKKVKKLQESRAFCLKNRARGTLSLRMRDYTSRLSTMFGYLKFLKKTKGEVFVALFAGMIYGVSSGFGIPVVLKFTADFLFKSAHISVAMLCLLVALPIVIMLIRGASGFLTSYYFSASGQHIVEELRMLIFKKIQRLHLGFFNDYPPSELVSRSVNACTIIQNSLIDVASDIITQPMTLLGSVGFLIYLCIKESNVAVLLLFLIAMPLVIFPIRRIGKELRRKSGKMQSHTAGIINNLHNNLSALKEVRSFCLEDSEIAKYRKACHAFSDAFLQVVKFKIIISPIVEVISAAGLSFAMVYAYKRGLGLEVFMSLATALYFCYDSLKKLGGLNANIQTALAAVDRIEAILTEPELLNDPQHPVPFENIKGNIKFNDVSFSYNDEKTVLKNINVELESGTIYALVGGSGAGKSTFVNLILRFYDVLKGEILIDDIDVREVRQKDLRKYISYIPQDPMLINDTVYNNLLWVNPKATKREIIDAAKKAYAHDFIMQLPNGYDTVIGEGGSCLSGGQCQRIALARVFLKDAPILIFDEATSALDSESQAAIFAAIKECALQKTVIIISHRFSMMNIVDHVLVFKNGEIVEEGAHEELLKSGSVYKKLYEKQRVK